MLDYLRNKLTSARLHARYERLIQQRLLNLLETTGPQPVADDPGDWKLLGDLRWELSAPERQDARDKARRLVLSNPYARNLLRLLEIYVVGPGLALKHNQLQPGRRAEDAARIAERLWQDFLRDNRSHFSYREYARRTWRDGECFLRKYDQPTWPPTVRFVDPETFGPTSDHADSQGILTDPHDVETPLAYLRIDPLSGELLEQVPADEMFHTKVGVDSNQKRGVTAFMPVLDVLECFENWRDTELQARKLQASIVLWRKVQGSPSQALSLADAAQTGTALEPGRSVRTERYAAGTILTTTHGTELEFLQPNTNFGDAVPLGRLLLLSLAAGAGLPEFMLTSDASNANFASTMVAEGPAVKLFQSEQQFFAGEFQHIWRWVMSAGIRQGLLPEDFFDRVEGQWTFPQLVNRDRNQDRLADVRLVNSGVLSRAEVARRDGVDPAAMRAELQDEGVTR